MTHEIRWQQRFDNFNRALQELTSAAELSQQRSLSELENKGLINIFELVHELAWNVLKDFLEFEGIQGIVGSRGAVREAFKRGVITEADVWMDMIDKRNLTSNTYNADLAQNLVTTIVSSYYPAFMGLQSSMRTRG